VIDESGLPGKHSNWIYNSQTLAPYNILLAPGINTQPNPLNGKDFETFSEDLLVAGKIACFK